ncbi:MAG: PAS domain S-box protein [Candidatus Thermoplasmatota archaeon]
MHDEPDIVKTLRAEEIIKTLPLKDQDYPYTKDDAYAVNDTGERCDTPEKVTDNNIELSNLCDFLFENINDLMVLLDIRGRIVKVNKFAYILSGFSAEEVIGKPFWSVTDLFKNDILVAALRLFRGILQGDHIKNYKFEFYDKKKKKHIMMFSTYPIKENGRYKYILLVGRDTTESEKTLEMYRNIVERAEEGILILKDSIVQYVNPALVSMWGGKKEEVIGTSFIDYVAPEDRSRVMEYYKQRVIGKKTPSTYEAVLVRKNGERVYAEINASVIPYDDGLVDLVIIRDITERKRYEERLREREEHFRALVENTDDVIIRYNRECKAVYVNPSLERYTGVSADRIIGKSHTDFGLPSDFVGTVEKAIRRVFETGESYRQEIQLPNGTWLDWLLFPEYSSTGEVLYVVATARDITPRKVYEAKLEESEQRFRSIFDDAFDMIQSVDSKGRFLYVNPAWLSVMGYSSSDVEHLLLTDIIHPDDLPHCVSLFSQIIGGARFERIRARFCAKDGRVVYVEGNASPRYMNGKVIGASCIFRDVTEQRLTEEALRRSEKRFHDLADMLPEPVFETDRYGRLTYGNRKLLEIFGLTDDDVEHGLNVSDVIAPEYLDRFKERFHSRISGNSSIQGNEYVFVKKDGSRIPLLVYSLPIFEDGEVVGTRGVAIDLTDIKKAYAEIKNLLRLKDDFVNQLGHDLKTPLSPLINLLPIVLERETDPKSKEMLKISLSCVNYMKELVVKTIELAKLNSNKISFDIERVDLSALVREVVSREEILFKERNISIENRVNGSLYVEVDKLRIGEVFDNILSNARRYIDKDRGLVIIDAVRDRDYVTVSVKDNGVGLRQDECIAIFNEFYKGDSSRHDLESTGLGLSICKRIIERHGGRIWAESPGLGKGTTIFFTLPCCRGEGCAGNESPKEHTVNEGEESLG